VYGAPLQEAKKLFRRKFRERQEAVGCFSKLRSRSSCSSFEYQQLGVSWMPPSSSSC